MKATLVLLALPLLAAADGAPFRVAFVGGEAHQDEFSSVPRALPKEGWTFTDFSAKEGGTAEGVKMRLFDALDDIDLVAVKPLAPDVFSGKAERWKSFLERGGAIVVTDANYPDKYVWTDMLGPDYRHPDGEGFAGWYPSWLDRFSPEATVRTFPAKQVDGGMLWYHFNMANAGKAWKPLVKCARHHQPCAIQASYGRGFVYLTNLTCPYPSFFENMRAAAEAARRGLEVAEAAGGDLTNAATSVTFAVRSSDGTALAPRGWSAELKIVSTTNAPVYRVTARGAAGKDGVVRFSLPVVNTVRGPARVLLSVKGEKRGEAVLIDRLQTFDDLLTIETPHYRGTVSTMRRKAAVEFAFRLNPAAEKLFRGGYHRAKVVAPDGQTVVASTKRARFSGLRGSLSLDVPQDAAAGTYSVHVEVTSATDKKRHVASAPFKIAAPMETQVLADQDNVLLRGGKPWFPLGMYHAQPEFWQEVHDLGIDLQQSMNWLDGDFPRLAAMKQPLLYETKHRWPENFAIWTKRLSVEPYAAMWYIADEPRDDLVWRWEACHRAAAENDPDHPTFSVLLHPTSFAYQKGISDLLAVDVYPLGRDGSGDLFEIQRKIRLCRQAVNDEKPVLAVLQSFGFESTDKFRVMAYLAVVSGAKGILWYPWQEGEPAVGVNTNPALKAALRSLTGELKGLAPAVLSLSTEELSLADGKVPALLCGDKTTGVKLICVNPTNARVAAPAPKVKGLRLPATIEVPAYGVVVL